MYHRIAALLVVVFASVGTFGQEYIIHGRRPAGGCTENMSSVVLFLNWEDDTCTSPITSYSPDASTEKSWDDPISEIGLGTAATIDDAGALGSSGCGMVVDAAGSSGSQFAVQNYENGDLDDFTDGCFAMEYKEEGVGTEPNDDVFVEFDLSRSHLTITRVGTGDEFKADVEHTTGTVTLNTSAGSCTGIADDGGEMIVEVCWSFNASGSDWARLKVDGVNCDESTGGTWTAETASAGDDLGIGRGSNTTGDVYIDRIGWSESSSFDWHDVWITQGCTEYVAP